VLQFPWLSVPLRFLHSLFIPKSFVERDSRFYSVTTLLIHVRTTVFWVVTPDAPEERIASILRVEEYAAEAGTR
jgi:hypothetical protein